jgi:ABC-2 type transport system permease protein
VTATGPRTGVLAARPHQRIALRDTLSKSVADRLPLAVGLGVFLGLMSLVIGPIYVSTAETLSEFMALMPRELLAMVGGADMSTPAGFLSGELYSLLAPAAVIFVAITSAAKGVAGEMESRSIGLLVANPVTRSRLAIDKTIAMLIHTGLTCALMALGVWLTIVITPLPIEAVGVAAMTLHLALLGSAAGGLAMLAAVVTGRRLVGMLVAAGVAAVAYIWSSFLSLVDSFEGLAVISPWYHYNGSDPLARGLEPVSASILAILTVCLLWASVRVFERRDLPG